MGNRHVRRIFHNLDDQHTSSARNRDYSRRNKTMRSLGRTRESRSYRQCNSRHLGSTRDEIRRLRNILGNEMPIMLAILPGECNYPCHLRKKTYRIKQCYSEQNHQQPCDSVRSCHKVRSFPCATYCRECYKKKSSGNMKPAQRCHSVAV
jgi:hypothetical protein